MENSLNQNTEDIPIQSKGIYGLPEEFVEESSEIDESGPLSTRVLSKNWKTRSIAYKELISDLESNQSYGEYSDKILKFLGDPNPNPQEKSLEILKTYLRHSPSHLLGYFGGILKILIEKNISNPKPSTKEVAKDLIVDLYTRDKSQITADLIKYLENKNPKLVAASVSSLVWILEKLSFKSLDIKNLSNLMAKAAEHINPNVRSEAMNWYKELYKQIQGGIDPYLDCLKKQQQDELKKQFSAIEVDTRAQIDMTGLFEPRDIFSKFNEKWAENVLELEKWVQKKEALEELNKEANYPKLAEKNPSALVSMAKRLLNDSNIHVVSQSVKLLGLLAKGQGKAFESYAKQMFSVLVLKFRDKNKVVVQETHQALEFFLQSISVDSALPFLESALQDKTVSTKINVLQFLSKVIDLAKPDTVRDIFKLVKPCTDDSNESVREASLKTLAEWVQKFQGFECLIADLPDSKKRRILFKKENRLGAAEKKPEDCEKENKMEIDVQEKVKNEKVKKEAESFFIPDGISDKVFHKDWKTKEVGLKELTDLARTTSLVPQLAEVHDIVFKCVNDFKENNPNLVKAALECLNYIYKEAVLPEDTISKIFIPNSLDKIADPKTSDLLKQCLLSVSEILGPNELVVKFSNYSKVSSKPKTLSESCEVLSACIKQFGMSLFELKPLLDYCKSCTLNTNPVIKKSGINLFKTMYSKIGCSLYEGLEEFKDNLKKSLIDECQSVQADPSPPTRQMRTKPKQVFSSELHKKQNISNQITSHLLEELESKDWKDKKTALEKIENLLPKRIEPNGLNELMRSLKVMLNDSNKVISKMTLELLNRIADSLGEGCTWFWRPIVGAIFLLFKDKTTTVRQAARGGIEKWASKVGPDKILSAVAEPLKCDSAELRNEILSYIVSNKSFLPKIEVKNLMSSILVCLQDKNNSIRNQAEVVFGELVEIAGFDSITPLLTSMKPAVFKSLEPVFEKYRGPARMKINPNHIYSKYNRNFYFVLPIKKNKIEVQNWEKIGSSVLEQVRSEIKNCTSSDFFELLVSNDLKEKQMVPNVLEGMMDNPCFSQTFHSIFEWALLEFSQNSTQSSNIATECINLVLKYSKNRDIRPSDSEFETILPILAVKGLEPNTSANCKNAIFSCFELYSEERAYSSLVQGLGAKGLRLDVLSFFKEVYLKFKGPTGSRVSKFIETFTKSKDQKIRDEASEILAEISKRESVDKRGSLSQGRKQGNQDKNSLKSVLNEIIEALKNPDIKVKYEGLNFLYSSFLNSYTDFEVFSCQLREDLVESLIQVIHFVFFTKKHQTNSLNFELMDLDSLKGTISLFTNFFAFTNILKLISYGYLKSIYSEFILISSTKDIANVLSKELANCLQTIMDNTEDTTMFQVLFDILPEEISVEHMQICSKCLIRNANFMRKLNLNHSKVLVFIHECTAKLTQYFFDELEPRIRVIKNILLELVFLAGENIYEIYEEVIRNHPIKDEHIEDWINVVVQGNYQVFKIFERIKIGDDFNNCVFELAKIVSTAKINIQAFAPRYEDLWVRVNDALIRMESRKYSHN